MIRIGDTRKSSEADIDNFLINSANLDDFEINKRTKMCLFLRILSIILYIPVVLIYIYVCLTKHKREEI